MKEVLMTLLSKVYKLDAEAAAELLEKTDENEIANDILALDSARVKQFKEDGTKRFNDGHKKGKSESLKTLEDELKEKFEVSDTNLQGLALIEHIVQTQSEAGADGKITDDVVKKHPAYLELEKQVKTTKQTVENEWKKKLDEVENGYKQKETHSTVKNKAMEILDELNPVLPEDGKKAAKAKNWFLNELINGNKYEVTDDGQILMLDKDGKRMEDEHGNAKSFDDFVKTLAEESFELNQSKERSSAGNGGEGSKGSGAGKGGGKSKTKIPTPKNVEELSKVLNDSSIPLEERQEVSANYEAAHQTV